MKKYILRVQLSIQTDRNYTILRDSLLKVGFTKRIKSKAGVEYRLPNGNYYVETTTSMDDVFEMAKKIALQVTPDAMVLLTEVNSMTWSGLQKC